MTTHDPIHRQAWELIPWLVNDTLEKDTRERIEAHLCTCADCREELAFQRRIQAGMEEDLSSGGVAAPVALARLFERIDAEDEAAAHDASHDPLDLDDRRPATRPGTRVGHARTNRWLVAAVIVEALALGGLGTLLASQHDAGNTTGSYVTLSQALQTAPDAAIRLVPSPTLRVGELQALLGEAGLRIVGSNAGGTILALGFDRTAGLSEDRQGNAQRQRIEATVRQLRANQAILLVEPIVVSSATPP